MNPETRRNAAIIALVGVTVSFMLYFAAYKSRQAKNAAIVQNLIGGKNVSGQQAPDFELKKIDGSGQTVKLSDYRGRAVMINFWATWCGPCKIEMPWFIDLKKKYADQGFEIIGVAMENTELPEIKAFADKMGVNYVVLKGKEEMYAKYGDFEGLPTTFFIDKNGVITAQYQGLHSKSDFEDRIRESLQGYSASNHSEHK